MPLEDGEQYILPGNSMIAVFDRVKKTYPSISPAYESLIHQPEEELQVLSTAFFKAGAAFLAKRETDVYMKDIGETLWTAITRGSVIISYSLEESQDPTERKDLQVDEPYMFFLVGESSGIPTEISYITVPPEFILRAASKPFEALAAIIFLGSQIRDFTYTRLQTGIDTQEEVEFRAYITEAHFWVEVAAKYPDIPIPDHGVALLEDFPRGLYSPGLPNKVTYRRPSPNST